MAHSETTLSPPSKPFIKAYFTKPQITKIKRLAKAKQMSASTFVINVVMEKLERDLEAK